MEGKESGFRSWSPYGRKTEEAEDMDAELQDGQGPIGRGGTGRGLEDVIYFQRPKARAKVVKKSIYTNKKQKRLAYVQNFYYLCSRF